MQFAGQFIVQCQPVAVTYCVCIVYTLSNFCCLCVFVCVRVSRKLHDAADSFLLLSSKIP